MNSYQSSIAEVPLVSRLIASYACFDPESVETIGSLYHPNVVFIDPVKQIEGQAALVEYFTAMAAGLTECRFHFNEVICDYRGEAIHQAALFWDMHYSHPKIRSGKLLHLPGSSHIKFADSIYYHRDYYDLGQMLYEHLPLLKTAIGHIKKRL